ncbi:Sulfite reductase, dissimilatory-type subunit alpha [bioreactor metagenome]|uniref:Sulfite reductase, dissimilatory-type subunit alpha n=1 Tax=bioreactor metagenome TaxID=1076179 RepID=A0A644TLT7_9ZZZZ|nr:dissimilatory-type sulfite reductase subunit alpha [Negativicutes bacterium]
MDEFKTPLLDELEKGDWPSFVSEIKKAAKTSPGAADLLRQLELSYKEKVGHWKHGGIVGVRGYGGGVVGRYSDVPEEFPHVREFHTARVNQVAGFFYTAEKLRQLADVWDKYGSGLYNMHGSTGDIILLGTTTENLQPCVDELSDIGFDLGGSGGAMRTLSCCVGKARCEKACIDSTDIIRDLTMHYQDVIHRPQWPYKFKIKVSACPNDCAAASARSDLAVMGVWRDALRIDQEAVREYIAKGFKINEQVVNKCPTEALSWDAEKQELNVCTEECTRCMHCINVMPKAISIGKETGATLLIGGKVPVVKGPMIGWVLVPFMKMEPPYTELKDLVDKITDWWADNAKNRERVGELIERVGLANFLEVIGLKPVPQMVKAPRHNPYIFWNPEEVEKRG